MFTVRTLKPLWPLGVLAAAIGLLTLSWFPVQMFGALISILFALGIFVTVIFAAAIGAQSLIVLGGWIRDTSQRIVNEHLPVSHSISSDERFKQDVRGRVSGADHECTDEIAAANDRRQELAVRVEIVVAAADEDLKLTSSHGIQFLPPTVGDQDLVLMAGYRDLKWAVLDDTNVTDAGLERLHCLKRLRTVYVRRTHVTANGVAALKSALPDVNVIF